MLRNIVSVLCILVTSCLASEGPAWSYTNPDHNPLKWHGTHSAMCSGRFQSPIALISDVATFMGTNHQGMVHISSNTSRDAATFSATNNGHTLAVSIPDGEWKVTLNNLEKDEYTVSQFHFHWGSRDTKGSEHTLDNTAFPLEMHIVSYSSMYASFAEAKSSPGGLAVIGVFFQLTTNQAESSLSKMGNLFSSLGGLSNAGSKVNVNAFKPDVLLPQNKDEFFRYQGSLTTPPCTENVQWTVMRHSLKVTNEDLVKLRSLHFGNNDGNKPMQDNFRPVKSLNTGHAPQTRVLYKSWSASGRIVPALVPVVSELTLGMLSR